MDLSVSRPNLVALIVACAFFMQTLDSNIVGTALPQIAVSFGVNPVQLSIGLTAYMLSLAVFVPISGWVADRFGSRPVFQAAVALFTLGSLLCGISHNLIEFVGARILQGMGGAMVVPVGRLVVLRAAKKSELVRALAFLSVPTQIGPALGPPLGGLITTYASWRWVFLINLPIGLVGMVLAQMYMQNHKEPERFPLDWGGFLLSGTSLSCLLYGIDAIGRGDAGFAQPIGFIAAGLITGAGLVWHARHHPHPLINLSLMRIPSFSANVGPGSCFRTGAGALPFLLPLMMQTVFGLTAFASGLITFVSAIGSISMRANASKILKRFGFRNVLIANGVISSFTFLMCGFFTPSVPVAIILFLLLVGGLFQALQLFSLNSICYAEIPNAQMSAATSLSQLMQQLGKTGGVALGAVLLHVSLNWRGESHLASGDFLVAFGGLALISLVSVPFYRRLDPGVGAELTGYVPPSKLAAGEEAAPGE